jgi:selenocysteine lyase/cysteine desulfurase
VRPARHYCWLQANELEVIMPQPSWHSEFPLRDDLIYLNHAGVAPWPQRSADAVAAFAQENAELGARQYPNWLKSERGLRTQLRELINAPAEDDIALLKNTSEGLSFVASGLDWKAGDNIVTSDEEFPSNRIVWQSLAGRGVELRQIALRGAGILSPEQGLIAACDARTRLLAISSVQYASGLRMDLAALGRYCRQHNILFCVDAIQSIGAVAFDVQAINADFAVADGHKWMLGPEGVALFYVRPDLREQLRLSEYGWHMVADQNTYEYRDWQPHPTARRFECGSPNMLGIIGLSASLSLLLEVGMPTVEELLLEKTRFLMQLINDEPMLELVTDPNPGRYAGIVSFRHTNMQPIDLYSYLSDTGIVCAMRGGSIRYSPHFYTPLEKLERAVKLAAEA